MYWNYRVMKRKFPPDKTTQFCIHEVYYDEKDDKPDAWTKDSLITADSLKDLKDILAKML